MMKRDFFKLNTCFNSVDFYTDHPAILFHYGLKISKSVTPLQIYKEISKLAKNYEF